MIRSIVIKCMLHDKLIISVMLYYYQAIIVHVYVLRLNTSIQQFCLGVWGVLWAFGCRMLEFEQGCLEIFWHGDVARACGMVPVNVESAEEGTSTVDGDGV